MTTRSFSPRKPRDSEALIRSEPVDFKPELPRARQIILQAAATDQMILHADQLNSIEGRYVLKQVPFGAFAVKFHQIDFAAHALDRGANGCDFDPTLL